MPSVMSLLVALFALLAMSQGLALPINASIATYSIPGRYDKSYCGWYGNRGSWEIFTKGWGRHDTVAANDAEHGALSIFKLDVPFNGGFAHCIEEAIWNASGEKDRVKCRNMEHDE